MQDEDFSDASLVLIGHGSTRNKDSALPVRQHAAEIRRRGIFREVLEGFFIQDPAMTDTVRNATGRRVFIVPIFISEGYFTEEVLPTALGFCREGEQDFVRVQVRARQTVLYGRPIGTHPSMTRVILARAREVAERFPFPRAPKPSEITLFVAGHGTDKNENSRQAIERHTELIAKQRLYADVQAAFMEEEPRIESCYERAATKCVILVPFFISDGLHVREDIPLLLGEPESVVRERLQRGQPTWRNPTERKGKLLWFTPSVGSEPQIAEVILERVREMVGNVPTT